jgi:hypothetical protein
MINKKEVGKEIGFVFLMAFIQTILFLLILFVLERTGIFAIQVTNFNRTLIYPGEIGGFFFGMILIPDIVEEIIRYKLKG